MSNNIAVIGGGYVGLVTASCMAATGNKVRVYDIDEDKIAQLQKAKVPFYEPELDILIKNNLNLNLSFSTDIKESLKNVEACFIAVGTPHDKKTNKPDLSFFYDAIDKIIDNLSGDILIVNKSTLPLGTAKEIREYIRQRKTKYRVSIATNPEFLSQGRAVKDFMNPQRIVLGIEDEKDYKLLMSIYGAFAQQKNTVFVKTNIATAELIKYTANSFLAMKVSFINEIAEIAANIGADISDVTYAVGLDNRIGNKFLNPGPGYGGSCFPKDSKALSFASKSLNLDLPLVQNIDLSNENRINSIADRLIDFIEKKKLDRIAILGMAFKAGTDDVRDAQAIKIINYVLDKLPDIKIHIHDPMAVQAAYRILIDDGRQNNIVVMKDLKMSLKDILLFCIMTEWEDYKNLGTELSKYQTIMDFRNIVSDVKYEDNYYCMGKNL